jgi:hypothetical protein
LFGAGPKRRIGESFYLKLIKESETFTKNKTTSFLIKTEEKVAFEFLKLEYDERTSKEEEKRSGLFAYLKLTFDAKTSSV